MNINNPSKTYTLEDFIKEGKSEDINAYIISYVKIMEDCIIPIYNIWSKYRDLLLLPSNSTFLVLNDDEFEQFKFKPKKLSLTLYKTIELDHLILFLNNIVSVTQFNYSRIRVIKPQRTTILNDILLNEYDYLAKNKSDNKYMEI